MKKMFMTGTALLLISSSAMAADLSKPPPAAPVYTKAPLMPVFSWTGFYIGVHGSAAWSTNDFTGTPNNNWLIAEGPAEVAFLTTQESPSLNKFGGGGGGQIGFNYQTGAAVLGVEVDATALSLKNTNTVGPLTGPFGVPTVFTQTTETDWLATARARFGWAVDRALFYVTGGGAFANVQASERVFRVTTHYNSFGSVDTTRAGWTVGGGIEYAFAQNWTVRAEYLYVDLGTSSFTTVDQSGIFPTFHESDSVRTKLSIVSAGLNYKF